MKSKSNSLPENIKLTINGEEVVPNVTNSQTENIKVTITDNKLGPEDTQPEKEENQPALEADHSYANELASRIMSSGRSGGLRVIGVASEDFTKLHQAGLISKGMYLKNSGIVVVIHVDADTTGTYWDKSKD